MSHFDDIDVLFFGVSPKTIVGLVAFLALAACAVVWAVAEDAKSRAICKSHGEVYVDGREDYTLCAADGGMVNKR